ncbi:TetR/AcrR family transcriptional regulator [Cellulomonas soli]|uniref:HTH tetR-type domain-containing protein n=1 Tax=Cellulomonas soli TaxID=931535 RepID=A0A512PCM5_9CELL|nr:TetR/AcrR family transcriptional regulator [Cellulomonas soli]NYI58539.1 AcrR family transcriptional regulator [Cellulomonas soli]GEP68963.1 hypothetical protein CSO01_16780 [Cellulomonas soli]
MTASRQRPARRPRMSDADTRSRMLSAAVDLLAERGVTVGLDGLALEDVIRHADVSRTSAYRRWPTRDAFHADVLLEVARGTDLPGIGARVVAEAEAVLEEPWVDLGTVAGRHELFVELMRLSFQADLEGVLASPQFGAYLALRAAFASVPEPDLRDELAAELQVSERRTLARGAAILAGAARLLGLRLVAPLDAPDGYTVVARAVSAMTTGSVIAAQVDPALVHATQQLAPFGVARTAAWSVPTFTLTGLVLGHLEPDPGSAALDADDVRRALLRLVEEGRVAAGRPEAAQSVTTQRSSWSDSASRSAAVTHNP